MEWDPLTARELAVAQAAREHFDSLSEIPMDMFVSFVRASRGRETAETTIRRLEDSLVWRAEPQVRADEILAKPPPQRRRFEELYQAGPVGSDQDGRPVIVERVGQVVPA